MEPIVEAALLIKQGMEAIAKSITFVGIVIKEIPDEPLDE